MGCAGNEENVGWVQKDSAGIRISINSAPQWSTRDAWRLDEAPMVTIGREDGTEEYTFSRIEQILPIAGGWLIADRDGPRLSRYDTDGRHLFTFGRRGRGPGEFLTVSGMSLVGDSIVVLDGRLQRLTFFSFAGDVFGTTKLESTGNPAHPLHLYRLAGRTDEGLVLIARAFAANMSARPTIHWDASPTLLYSLNGSLLGPVAEPSGMDMFSTPERAGPVIFGRMSSGDVARGKIFMSDGGSNEVRVYRKSTAPAAIIRIAAAPVPVEPQHAAEKRRLRSTVFSSAGRAEWPTASTYPALSGLIVGTDGIIWAEKWSESADAPRVWHLFARNGRWLGDITVPSEFTITAASDSVVAGIWRDPATHVQSVRVYRLRKARQVSAMIPHFRPLKSPSSDPGAEQLTQPAEGSGLPDGISQLRD